MMWMFDVRVMKLGFQFGVFDKWFRRIGVVKLRFSRCLNLVLLVDKWL
jgi:hypothetical protein